MDDFSKLPIGDHHATIERGLVRAATYFRKLSIDRSKHCDFFMPSM